MFMFQVFLFNWLICLCGLALCPFLGDWGTGIETRGGRWEGERRAITSRPPAFPPPPPRPSPQKYLFRLKKTTRTTLYHLNDQKFLFIHMYLNKRV